MAKDREDGQPQPMNGSGLEGDVLIEAATTTADANKAAEHLLG